MALSQQQVVDALTRRGRQRAAVPRKPSDVVMPSLQQGQGAPKKTGPAGSQLVWPQVNKQTRARQDTSGGPIAPADIQRQQALKTQVQQQGLNPGALLKGHIAEKLTSGGLTPQQRALLETAVMEQTAAGTQHTTRAFREYMGSRGLLESSSTEAGIRQILTDMTSSRMQGMMNIEMAAIEQQNIAAALAGQYRGQTIQAMIAQQQIQAQQDAGLLDSLFGIGAAVGGFLIGGPAGAAAGSAVAGTVTKPKPHTITVY
jgi:hypothetical protein